MKILISAFLILFSITAFCGSAFDLGNTVSGKANKVSGATSGNLAALNSDGDLQDSGKSATSGFISSVTGTTPITATTSGSGVTLAHSDSGATTGTYGVSGSSIPIVTIDAKGHVTYASSWLTTLITSVGTITTGTWQGTAVGVAYGGTGSTTAAGALTALGAAPAAGSSSITTVGTIGSGTWNGTAIDIAHGGTGSTTAAGALTSLGASPTAGSSSLVTLGTVTTGTWQGTAVGVAYGGTGGNTAATARTNLGLGDSSTKNVGTSAGTVAAGDDSRFSCMKSVVFSAVTTTSTSTEIINDESSSSPGVPVGSVGFFKISIISAAQTTGDGSYGVFTCVIRNPASDSGSTPSSSSDTIKSLSGVTIGLDSMTQGDPAYLRVTVTPGVSSTVVWSVVVEYSITSFL